MRTAAAEGGGEVDGFLRVGALVRIQKHLWGPKNFSRTPPHTTAPIHYRAVMHRGIAFALFLSQPWSPFAYFQKQAYQSTSNHLFADLTFHNACYPLPNNSDGSVGVPL